MSELSRRLHGLRQLFTAASAAVVLVGCGGAGGSTDQGSQAPAPAPAPAPPPAPPPPPPPAPPPPPPTPVAACGLEEPPAKPGGAFDVRSFGALPDDGRDDTAAIQAALDSLPPGGWLLFPPGVYEHGARLTVRTPGAVLWSEGATLHATNAADQAILLAADGASIYNFTLTAVTAARLNAPWQARIAVFDRDDRSTHLRSNVIRGNRVIEGGAPGTPAANSASSAGIFVYRADDFLIAENEVRRSLADGIHVTGGSKNGRVLANTVRQTGDDMIAIVSYLANGSWIDDGAAQMAASFAGQRDLELVRNVLVAFNDVSGQYWGRGISVVGGADITIRDNRIAQTTTAAGVLLAREASFVTWGVNNVVVRDNAISQVQTTLPAYTPPGWPNTGLRTGHAGVEIHSFVFDDERAYGDLLAALAVQDVRVTRNSVTDTGANGVRIGEGTGVASTLSGTRSDGTPITRTFSGGPVGRVELSSIDMSLTAAGALAIKNQPTLAYNVYCEALSSDGQPVSDPACGGASPAVTGASKTCAR